MDESSNDNGGTSTAPLNNASEEANASQEGESQETETQSQEGGEEEVKLTDKGTKLDPNPLSAANQQLANANQRIGQMERVLGSPELLRKYAKDSGISLTEAKAEIKETKDEVKAFTPDDFKTADDVANILNEIRSTSASELKTLRKENQSLRDGFKDINSRSQVERVTNSMQQDITTVQGKYPELNPKSQEYDKELEGEIASLFHELDYDQQSKSHRGNVSIAKLTDRVMRAAGKARKQGSQQAQTDVKVKQAGKVVTSGKTSKGETESSDPATAISQRIAKTLGYK